MHGLANSGFHSNRKLCRAFLVPAIASGTMILSGCMATTPRTLETSKLLGQEVSHMVARHDVQLDLNATLLSDALRIQSVVIGSVASDSNIQFADLSSFQSNYMGSDEIDGHTNMLGSDMISWNNGDTGNRGRISSLDEIKTDDKVCRKFTTSRLSYDGVRNFEGLTCKTAENGWNLERFQPEI